jgi:hypothetical protein
VESIGSRREYTWRALQEQHIAHIEGRESAFGKPRRQACINASLCFNRNSQEKITASVFFLRSCSDSWALATASERSDSPFFSADTRCDLDSVDDRGNLDRKKCKYRNHIIVIPDITLCLVNHSVNICYSEPFLRKQSNIILNEITIETVLDGVREYLSAPETPEIDSSMLFEPFCHAQYPALCSNSLESILSERIHVVCKHTEINDYTRTRQDEELDYTP